MATFLFWFLIFAAGLITRDIAGPSVELATEAATHLADGIYLTIAILGVALFRKVSGRNERT